MPIIYAILVRVQAYLNLPLVNRCRELAILIEQSSTTELQHVFPVLIDSLFGVADNVGWGLHSINLKRNPQEYEALCNFLGPLGPIFSLCYKLLPDCFLKYNFAVSYLPAKIRSMLEEGIIPPFYSDKIRDEQNARLPSALAMNPFEYYIFHFAYHLTNAWLQQPQQENVWANWETIYVQLAHNYLYHFLPRDNSPVLPIIGPYVKKTPPRKLMQSPESKRLQTTRLLRTSILSPGSTSPTSGVPQQQCLPQVWRSETVVQVFLDFWLEYTEEEQFSPNLVTASASSLPRKHSIHSGEHIRLVRAFIKTLHEFANSATGDRSAMDELKRVILPSVQGKIYLFLKKAIHHWPLDSSFRLILEAWLSFIQPWRYMPGVGYIEEGKLEEEEKGKIYDSAKWVSFVANNLLAYTAIFQQLLPRFMRIDLVAPKNALMLFRVTKVFSQSCLTEILSEVESCMDDVALSRGRLSSNQWTAIVRQQILELEGPLYQYIPIFSVTMKNQVLSFLYTVRQAQLTAISLLEALEKRRSGRKLLLSIWRFFNGEDYSSDDVSLEERRRVPAFLSFAQERLIYIFRMEEEEFLPANVVADQEYHDTILSTSFCHQSQVDSNLDSSRPGVFVPIQDGKQNCRYVEYLGDPELQPVRSNEIAFLVRVLYQLCNYLNKKYQNELVTAYSRNDFLGRLARQVIKPPTTVVSLPKRGPNGFTSGCETRIAPRLSFRVIATYHFLGSILLGVLFFSIVGYGTTLFFGFFFFSWLVYILAHATCEPWLRLDNTATRRSPYPLSRN
ncbi:sphingomyelin phosphodiesterase 4 isoform X2 [Belonocnema kinseyi]|uniref:sphingomyelin phosphodiesterase 4 isoform X2 n=1 Tax=Belonocnema kinseyi TaxID=2817044 RepID=UPI00143D6B23|nr:sphingomyelin phosphodiesterase 4 isoform X2 [Belonocnema kinseyi]